MQITVYNYRDFDEKKWFDLYSKEMNIQLVICKDAPSMENAHLAEGSQCINIITSQVPEQLVKKFHELGVLFIATRTIGYDHINIEECRKCGIRVSNAPYGPEGVAEYTILMMLMCLRNMKQIMERTNIQDYTLKHTQGREMKDLTVGIIGTGRIGKKVIENLSGFGCKIICYDLFLAKELEEKVTYVSLEEIWQQSDIISLHTPLTDENFHLINQESIEKMKKGVIIVNTARGGLIDSESLIQGVENGTIGAAGLDVIENEFGLYYYDKKSIPLTNRQLAILRTFPNVTVTHHMAFYTDNAIQTMVGDSLKSCKLFMNGDKNPWEVTN